MDPRVKVAWFAEDLNNENKVSLGFKLKILHVKLLFTLQ